MALSRRSFLALGGTSALVALGGCSTSRYTVAPLAYTPVPQLGTPNAEPHQVPMVDMSKIDRTLHRQMVRYAGNEPAGTIVVDTYDRYLYLVGSRGNAIRYGIGVGREGFEWGGHAKVGRKAQWPTWTPPAEMIARDPSLAKYAGGMDGGPANPLGARALYLYDGGVDTLYRIHGTNEPWSIGQAMSSGCIRLLNHDIIDLYERVPVGTPVVVHQGGRYI